MAEANVQAAPQRPAMSQLAGPILVVLILAMMVLPLPPFAARPAVHLQHRAVADGAAGGRVHRRGRSTSRLFPTVLLLTTLLRLSLNVASTRVVLLHGHTGAGRGRQGDRGVRPLPGRRQLRGRPRRVRRSWSSSTSSSITKGAGRIAEVGARFTLDAMPGKQMAIDADLNAGLIGEDEARRRRAEVGAGGRLLRRDGRRQQVRARRRHRRHPDPAHQHHRRPRHRHRCSTTCRLAQAAQELHAAHHRRRPGRADPGAAASRPRPASSSRASPPTRTSASSWSRSSFGRPQVLGIAAGDARHARPDSRHAALRLPAARGGWSAGAAYWLERRAHGAGGRSAGSPSAAARRDAGSVAGTTWRRSTRSASRSATA